MHLYIALYTDRSKSKASYFHENYNRQRKTVTLTDRAHSKLQNYIFQHQLWIFDSNKQEPTRYSCRNLHQQG